MELLNIGYKSCPKVFQQKLGPGLEREPPPVAFNGEQMVRDTLLALNSAYETDHRALRPEVLRKLRDGNKPASLVST
jgi:hypothetical protein